MDSILKGENMKGLELLLLFAYGGMKNGVCADTNFMERVNLFLTGYVDLYSQLAEETQSQLKSAWPNLVIIGEGKGLQPLSLEVVEEYVFKTHNKLVIDTCKVKNGIVVEVDKEKGVCVVENKEYGKAKVSFLPPFVGKIKKRNKIYYHHSWFVKREK